LPSHVQGHFLSRDCLNAFNISLAVVALPLLTAAVLRLLGAVACKESRLVDRAWRLTLGSYTYYGLLFLAYGVLAFLVVDLRFFAPSSAEGEGIGASLAFALLLALYAVLLNWAPTSFGSFRKKFFKFEASQYFYSWAAVERLLTVLLVVCFSPGLLAALLPLAPIACEAAFIAVKRPYVLGKWHRPLANKLLSLLLCALFAVASQLDSASSTYALLPFAVLALLLTALVYGTVALVRAMQEYCQDSSHKLEVTASGRDPVMSTMEANKLMMFEFERKMMPTALPSDFYQWKPLCHDQVDLENWRWRQYPILYGLDMHNHRVRKARRI
jgi:hypothetical protein